MTYFAMDMKWNEQPQVKFRELYVHSLQKQTGKHDYYKFFNKCRKKISFKKCILLYFLSYKAKFYTE